MIADKQIKDLLIIAVDKRLLRFLVSNITQFQLIN